MPIITCPNCGAKNRVDERADHLQPVCGRCGEPLGASGSESSAPVIVTDATFQRDVLEADKPVLLDCWAPWCGPCRLIAPTIDQIAAESEGRSIVGKLNTDENPQTAGMLRISSIPALLIFNRGKLVDQTVGVQPKQAIAARLTKFL